MIMLALCSNPGTIDTRILHSLGPGLSIDSFYCWVNVQVKEDYADFKPHDWVIDVNLQALEHTMIKKKFEQHVFPCIEMSMKSGPGCLLCLDSFPVKANSYICLALLMIYTPRCKCFRGLSHMVPGLVAFASGHTRAG